MAGEWPAWATEPVRVEPFDPAWLGRAEGLCRDLRLRLAPWLDGEVEHVGSTAVPGLPAKPTVDLMAPVVSVQGAAAADAVLAEAGWSLVPPELDQRPWRRFYVLPEGARRVAHLHLVSQHGDRWGQVLAFRDRLRARPDLARQYAERKVDLARRHPHDREAYTDGKATFIERALE
jgi:GrpB-like predicted nucleotidyltransferase (UPF0157 family)